MRTNHHNETSLGSAIRSWAHVVGVHDERPVDVAVDKAVAAYHRGATVAEAAGVARAYLLCWLRHPANGSSARPHAA
jgi:hypothetical protein